MSEKQYTDRLEKFKNFARNLGFQVNDEEDYKATSILIRGMLVRIRITFFQDGNIFTLYGYVRTSSWDFTGERTDMHDVISSVAALILRVKPPYTSTSLWSSTGFTEIPTEIYERYIVLEQPFTGFNSAIDNDEQIEQILANFSYCEYLLLSIFYWCSCEDCLREDTREAPPYLFDFELAQPWARVVSEILGETLEEAEVQFNFRNDPTWAYYRSVTSNLSVLFAPELIRALVRLVEKEKKWTSLDGIFSKLFISDNVQNAISNKKIKKAEKILTQLELAQDNTSKVVPLLVPIENHFFALGDSYAVFFDADTGKKQFEKEKEKIRVRHSQETHLLFPVKSFEWNTKIDGELFELLVYHLLMREPNVAWVRKVSQGNERDGGRDLIVELWTPPIAQRDVKPDNQSPYLKRKIIVQCKGGYKKGVGKAEVTDIRDTIEHYEAEGYFLVVSSHLTTELTTHLEKLRNNGKYWIDWWSRTEIEERLRLHPDIVTRFSAIVRAKDPN